VTPEPRPAYPRTPAYGEGVSSRGRDDQPDLREDPDPSAAAEPVRPHGVGLSLGMAVGLNLVTLVGVLVLGWPAGNVFLLFWCENVVLGLVTLVRVVTAEAPDQRRRPVPGTTTPGPARATVGSRVGTGVFFCVHYGIFCAVHLVFTYLVAGAIGLEITWLLLGLPVVLILVRYGVELATTWFGSAGLRARTSPGQAMGSPYPRIAVLHLAVLLTFFVGLAGLGTGLLGSPGLPGWARGGVLPVALLLALKTAFDLATTRRALRPR
jgi:hypothetical protein